MAQQHTHRDQGRAGRRRNACCSIRARRGRSSRGRSRRRSVDVKERFGGDKPRICRPSAAHRKGGGAKGARLVASDLDTRQGRDGKISREEAPEPMKAASSRSTPTATESIDAKEFAEVRRKMQATGAAAAATRRSRRRPRRRKRPSAARSALARRVPVAGYRSFRTRRVSVGTRFWQTLRLGLKSLLLHKLRSGLAILGIFIGVTAVIWLVAMGEGVSYQAQQQIKDLGANNIIIRSAKPPADVTARRRVRHRLRAAARRLRSHRLERADVDAGRADARDHRRGFATWTT